MPLQMNVKFFVCLIKHLAIVTVEVTLHVFYTSVLHGSVNGHLKTDLFTRGEGASGAHRIRSRLGPKPVLEKKDISPRLESSRNGDTVPTEPWWLRVTPCKANVNVCNYGANRVV
jgi:hypothetical protein